MIKFIKLSFLIIFLSLNNIFSGNVSLIDIPTCKTIALANETSVLENNGFSTITNPSLLNTIKAEYALEYSRIFYYSDSFYDLLSLTSNKSNIGIGLVVGRFSSGVIKIRDIDGLLTGETIEYIYGIASLGISTDLLNNTLHTFRLGLSGYTFLERIDFDSIYFGLNSGFSYELKLKNKIIRLIRMGGTIKLINIDKDSIYNVGVAIKIPESMVILGYQNNSYRRNQIYNIGYIFNIYTSSDFKKYLKLNLGYKHEEFSNNISSGIEFGFYNFLIFYSFSNHKYLKNIHSLQISVVY